MCVCVCVCVFVCVCVCVCVCVNMHVVHQVIYKTCLYIVLVTTHLQQFVRAPLNVL